MTQITISEPVVNFTLVSSLLIAQVTGGAIPYYYEFGNQNGMIIASTNFGSSISFNPIANGIYYFFIIDDNNCVSDTVFYIIDILPAVLKDVNIENLFIYPNPSSGLFNISFESLSLQHFEISLSNMIGKEIFSDRFNNFSGKYIHKIDLSTNAKGIYFLEIKTNDGVINKKLILQ